MPQHRHLRRLTHVFIKNPVYFVTTCTRNRARVLATAASSEVLIDEWRGAAQRHRWQIGRYVIMPDHVHFFACPEPDSVSLVRFVGHWKEWTGKRLHREIGLLAAIWQPQFFDHVLRSTESYAEKWEYVRQNPVRAGIVSAPDQWPYAGYIDFDEPM